MNTAVAAGAVFAVRMQLSRKDELGHASAHTINAQMTSGRLTFLYGGALRVHVAIFVCWVGALLLSCLPSRPLAEKFKLRTIIGPRRHWTRRARRISTFSA